MARVSIKNIAQTIGVSNAAVSLVLNGKEKEGRVGKEMADRIRKVAKEMNYEPNSLARGLRIGCSQTIGLIVADISNLFFANLAFHIQEAAEKNGYSVIIANTNESDEKMSKMIQVLKSRQVDGFIIVPTENGEKDISALLKNNTVPVVLLDRYYPNLETSYVVVDNYQASFKAVDHLINSGCKKIGMVIYSSKLLHMQERKRGYIEALQKTKLFHPELIKEIAYTNLEADIVQAVNELLSDDVNVDGVFFATNSISIIGIKSMIRKNVNIPQDVKVICFDKNDAFDLAHIPIPFVQQPIQEMSQSTVDLLIRKIKSKSNVPVHLELLACLQNNLLKKKHFKHLVKRFSSPLMY